MSNILVVACARVASSRFPGKIKQEVMGQPALLYQLAGMVNECPWPVVLATTKAPEDDWTAEIGERAGVEVHRGQDDSPLDRMLACGLARSGTEYVVRCTHDDLFYDWDIAQKQAEFHAKHHTEAGAAVTTNLGFLDAAATEVYALAGLVRMADAVHQQGGNGEMIGNYRHLAGRVFNFDPPHHLQVADRQEFRLELDWPEDLAKIRTVLGAVGPYPSTDRVLNFLRENPEINNMNAHRRKA